MSDLDDILGAFDATPDKTRGPWCSVCGHEYRTKKGDPEIDCNRGVPYSALSLATCPYCFVSGAPVLEKPFFEVSKSSIELWERCPRRWFFKYIAHFPEPKNRFAAWGIEAHEVAEDYLARGMFPIVNDLEPKSQQSKIARSLLGGMAHMPRPDHPGLRVEGEFHFLFEGVHYGGFKDYEAPVAWPLMATCEPIVGDHKFTGNLQYALTQYELAGDKQAVIYAWDVLRKTAHDRMWLNWVYMMRGEAVARPVRVCVDRASVLKGMRKLTVVGRHLTQLRARKDLAAKDFPPNEKACYDFKEPCPHMDPCDGCGDRNATQSIGG